MAFLRMKTSNGHVIGEVYSAFQKSIRRGLLNEALYFGSQIASASKNALKKRIMLIILEDICDLELCLEVNEISLDGDFNTVITKACLSPKTHISAWLNRVSVQHLIDDKSVCEDRMDALVSANHELKAAVRGMYLLATKKPEQIFDELEPLFTNVCTLKSMKSLFKYCNNTPLLWLVLILQSTRPEFRSKTSVEEVGRVEIPSLLEIPDWAYDKHTSVGKKMKRGYQHFFEVSLVMLPRRYGTAEEPYEAEAKALYLSNELKTSQVLSSFKRKSVCFCKANDSDVKDQSTSFHNSDDLDSLNKAKRVKVEEFHQISESQTTEVLQAQCITSKGKPKVLFFRDNSLSSEIFVAKGPCPPSVLVQNLASQRLKVLLGLPHIFMEKRVMDAEHPPLLGQQPGWYLVSELAGIEKKEFSFDNFQLRTTKLEENVRISTNSICHWKDEFLLEGSRELIVSCLLALAFRKCIGTNDTCARNLLIVDASVLSIDDPALFSSTPFIWKKVVNGKLSKQFKEVLSHYWEDVRKELGQWIEKIAILQAENDEELGQCNVTLENLQQFSDVAVLLAQSTCNWKF